MTHKSVKLLTTLAIALLIGLNSSVCEGSSSATSSNVSSTKSSSSNSYENSTSDLTIPTTELPTAVPETFQVVVIRKTDVPATPPPTPPSIPTATSSTDTASNSDPSSTVNGGKTPAPKISADTPTGNAAVIALSVPGGTEIDTPNQEDKLDSSFSTSEQQNHNTSAETTETPAIGNFRSVVGSTSSKSTSSSNLEGDAGSRNESGLKGEDDSRYRYSSSGSLDDVYVENASSSGSTKFSSSDGGTSSEIGSEDNDEPRGSEINAGSRVASWIAPVLTVIAFTAL